MGRKSIGKKLPKNMSEDHTENFSHLQIQRRKSGDSMKQKEYCSQPMK